MGKNSAGSMGPIFIMITAFFVFIACAVLFGFSHGVKRMPGFESMNEFAKSEITTHTAPGGEPANKPDFFTTNKAMTAVMVFGVLGMLASVGACIGAKTENACLLIVYFFVCVSFGAALIMVSSYGASFADVMEPVMARQIDAFCNETTYRTFKTELNCYAIGSPTATPPTQAVAATAASRRLGSGRALAVPATAAPAVTAAGNEIAPGTAAMACGEDCQRRKALLVLAGGSEPGACKMLKDLCTNWKFSTLFDNVATRANPVVTKQPDGTVLSTPLAAVNATGYCVLQTELGARRRAYAWTNQVTTVSPKPMDSSSCETYCNTDITCTGFTYRTEAKECLLITPVKPSTGLWQQAATNANAGVYPATAPSTEVLQNIVDADLDPSAVCNIKVMPQILWEMESYVETMAFASLIVAIFFFVTAAFTCCFMFTLGTKKQGKKGGVAMAHKLLCPCCRGGADRKGQDRGQYAGADHSESE